MIEQNKTSKAPASLNQAIPDKIQDRLVWLGNAISDHQWEIGDVTNSIIDWVDADADVDADDMSIYLFVAGLVGCGESTIRYYCYTCKEYAHDERDQYYPQLTFKHFHTAKQYGDLKFKVLDACLRYMDSHGGRRPSTNWIQRHFQGTSQVEPEIDQEVINDYEMTTEVIMPPVDDRYKTVGVWKNILTSTEYIRTRLFMADVTPERREYLGEMLDDFENEIHGQLE